MTQNEYDIIIIGGGPAGLTAGIYATRSRLKTLLLESMAVMSQATMTEAIENYPGIERIGGFDLIEILKKQAISFGLDCIQEGVKKISLNKNGAHPVWQVDSEPKTFNATSIIIASGAQPKRLDVPGENAFLGRGVSYCATCDGAFFRDKDIIVVGGGNTAVQEAVYLTRFGKTVTIVHRRDRLRATKVLQESAFKNDKINILWDSVVEEIAGTEKVEKIIAKNVKTGETSEIKCEGVFIFAGWHPNIDFVGDIVECTKTDGILTDADMKTSCDGIFAAGDCRHKILHQIVTACGDGAIAAFSAQQYVEKLKGTAYE